MPNVLIVFAAALTIWTPLNLDKVEHTLPGTTPAGQFKTLPPGSPLPGDAECAALVRPVTEAFPANTPFNQTPGNQPVASDFFKASDPRANEEIAPRITGNFTGTTDEILQWVACKWGIDENLVKAQAMQESNWRQSVKGDYGPLDLRCAPGHELGVDGRRNLCPQSWGIMQVKYFFYSSTWPMIAQSTAYNADVAVAIWRACYEGYETWLNDIPRATQYGAGDIWGCMGRWYIGQWRTPKARLYINVVQRRLYRRDWER